MENEIKHKQHQSKELKFTQSIDFYWKFIAIYSLVLIIYSLIRGSIASGSFTIVLYDPVFILLAIFVIASAVGLLVNYYKKKSVITGTNYIIFRNRFREKKYFLNEIQRISVGKARFSRIQSRIRIIKINVSNRRRIIRIRLSSFTDEREMLKEILRLKALIKH